jgi:hypothetical protein
MVRIVCLEADAGFAANMGGPVKQEVKTFDVNLPLVEEWLRKSEPFCQRSFVGIELLPKS